MSRRAYLLVCLFAFALVLLPFLFWYDTWFGRRLSDDQIAKYLADASRPRRAQQALAQIGERIARREPSAARWYPQVIALAAHASPELRTTAAWIMGQDPRYKPFHEALPPLIRDSSPLVRRNAALALAAFGDPGGRAELRAMLRPSAVVAPAAGVVSYRLKAGNYVNPGTLLGRVDSTEVRTELPGEVRTLAARDGQRVERGQPLAEVSPDDGHAWEALRALYLVGDRDDLDDVARFARGGAGLSDKLQQQAQLTARRIASRTAP